MFLTIVIFIIVLSLLVFAHELGHFFVARKFGVKAEEFGFGFPPRAVGIYKNNEGKWKFVAGDKNIEDAKDTVYSINWLPLGGFVKIKGENGDSDDADSFVNRKIWQRACILSAGVIMNIILAAALISFGFMIGLPQALDGVGKNAEVSGRKIQIIQVLPGTPADKGGIKLGDVIEKINGNNFEDYGSLQSFVDKNTNKDLVYTIKRADAELTLKIRPELMKETGRGGIGVGIAETGIVRYPWHVSIWEGIKTTAFLTWAILVAFYELIKNLILGNGVSADIAGPVGIASLTGQAARMGFVYILQFTAVLSINLAIINFLPFPALDGGRVLFLGIEKIIGRPVKRELEALIHNIGFSLLMILILLVTFKDVSRFGGFFKSILGKIIN